MMIVVVKEPVQVYLKILPLICLPWNIPGCALDEGYPETIFYKDYKSFNQRKFDEELKSRMV